MLTHLTYATRLASYREASEDRAIVIDLENRIVLILTDGAGGMGHSGDASDAVVAMLSEGGCIKRARLNS